MCFFKCIWIVLKRCLMMIGGYLFDYLLVLLKVLGMLLVGTGVGVVD